MSELLKIVTRRGIFRVNVETGSLDFDAFIKHVKERLCPHKHDDEDKDDSDDDSDDDKKMKEQQGKADKSCGPRTDGMNHPNNNESNCCTRKNKCCRCHRPLFVTYEDDGHDVVRFTKDDWEGFKSNLIKSKKVYMFVNVPTRCAYCFLYCKRHQNDDKKPDGTMGPNSNMNPMMMNMMMNMMMMMNNNQNGNHQQRRMKKIMKLKMYNRCLMMRMEMMHNSLMQCCMMNEQRDRRCCPSRSEQFMNFCPPTRMTMPPSMMMGFGMKKEASMPVAPPNTPFTNRNFSNTRTCGKFGMNNEEMLRRRMSMKAREENCRRMANSFRACRARMMMSNSYPMGCANKKCCNTFSKCDRKKPSCKNMPGMCMPGMCMSGNMPGMCMPGMKMNCEEYNNCCLPMDKKGYVMNDCCEDDEEFELMMNQFMMNSNMDMTNIDDCCDEEEMEMFAEQFMDEDFGSCDEDEDDDSMMMMNMMNMMNTMKKMNMSGMCMPGMKMNMMNMPGMKMNMPGMCMPGMCMPGMCMSGNMPGMCMPGMKMNKMNMMNMPGMNMMNMPGMCMPGMCMPGMKMNKMNTMNMPGMCMPGMNMMNMPGMKMNMMCCDPTMMPMMSCSEDESDYYECSDSENEMMRRGCPMMHRDMRCDRGNKMNTMNMMNKCCRGTTMNGYMTGFNPSMMMKKQIYRCCCGSGDCCCPTCPCCSSTFPKWSKMMMKKSCGPMNGRNNCSTSTGMMGVGMTNAMGAKFCGVGRGGFVGMMECPPSAASSAANSCGMNMINSSMNMNAKGCYEESDREGSWNKDL